MLWVQLMSFSVSWGQFRPVLFHVVAPFHVISCSIGAIQAYTISRCGTIPCRFLLHGDTFIPMLFRAVAPFHVVSCSMGAIQACAISRCGTIPCRFLCHGGNSDLCCFALWHHITLFMSHGKKQHNR